MASFFPHPFATHSPAKRPKKSQACLKLELPPSIFPFQQKFLSKVEAEGKFLCIT